MSIPASASHSPERFGPPPTGTHAVPAPRGGWVALLPGLALAVAIAAAATWAASLPALAAWGVSTLTVAIVAGMLLGNTLLAPARIGPACGAGLGFAKQRLLRAGIVLYGFRLTLAQVGEVGAVGIAVDAVMLAGTFGLAAWLGPRAFGLESRCAMLVGAGSAICGAAAVMATEPVVRARQEQVAVAVATVVLFGTVAMFGYPALYALASHLAGAPLDQAAFGLYIGSTVHEVAQALAAGNAVGAQAADAAVVSKMIRVMMLAPFLVLLSWGLARAERAGTAHADGAVTARREASGQRAAPTVPRRAPIAVPWFAVAFVGCVVLNSWIRVPAPLTEAIVQVDNVLLGMAMAALGLQTHRSALRSAGPRALLLAAVLAIWLAAGGALVNAAAQWLQR